MEALSKLIKDTEQRKQAEIERKALEQERLEIQRERLREEGRRAAMIQEIATAVELLVSMMMKIKPVVDQNAHRSRLTMEFIKVITGWIYREGQKEAETLADIIHDIGDQSMHVNIDGNTVNTGDIVDGTNIQASTFIRTVDEAKRALEKGEIDRAESIFNTLPADVIDVALAAMHGPISAARVIATKVGDKIKFTEENKCDTE